MKSNKKLFSLLVLIGTLSWFSIQPTAAHDMDSMHMDSKNGDDDNVMMGMDADEYWDRVKGDDFDFTGKIRKYYISADEVEWDYAPDGINIVNGSEFQGLALPFVEEGPERIGTTYVKCLYREYTDETFSKLKQRTQDEEYMGFLGPAIYAEVGDAIKVLFRNKCRFPASMHPHHLYYNKANEGTEYNDTTTIGDDKQDGAIEPGQIHCYTWPVPERSGPGPSDGSSIMSMYYSHVDINSDLYAGLVGPIAITRKGMATKYGRPKDVRQLFLLYSVTDESSSPYLAVNFEKYTDNPPNTPVPTNADFTNSNQMHGINGYIFGNGYIPIIKQYEQVRWCTFSLGNRDAHTPHWHGNTILTHGMRMDVTSIMPGEIVCSDMKADDIGYWLMHCHVGDHLDEGMVTRYQVIPGDKDDCDEDEKKRY